ncbi:MAG TPA: hypothetical protein VGC30_11155 [Dokdonella sp.]
MSAREILKRLGLDHLDVGSPDFLKTLERMQREAWESLREERARTPPQDEPAPPD